MFGPKSAPPAADDVVKNGSDANFKVDVIDASMTGPVIVDFWAPWCGPCKQLMPMLEKLVRGMKGKVKLVKINTDENPVIASQMRVQSIPMVVAFDKGRPLNYFQGALPESQVRAFIEKVIKDAGSSVTGGIEDALKAAAAALQSGDAAGAADIYAQVLGAEEDNVKAIAGLARCFLTMGDLAKVEDVLSMAPPAKAHDSDLAGVRAAMELAGDPEARGDVNALTRQIEADPQAFEARFRLAKTLATQGQFGPAVDQLLEIIQRDRAWNEEAARKYLLKLFDAAGAGSDIAKNGRKRLSAILFS